jgi:hypothetical protein
MLTHGKDLKVMWGDKELLVRNVEVSYSCDDLPSVSIEGFMPREQTIEVTMTGHSGLISQLTETQDTDASDSIAYAYETMKKKEDKNMRGNYDGDCETKSCDDGSYGAHGLAKKVVDLELDDRQKLIKKYELKQDDGTLTARGRELLLTLLFDLYEDEVVDALTALEEQRKADRD